MWHASPSTTLSVYAHMFDEARHAADIRARMARSAFAGLLEADEDDQRVITLPPPRAQPSGAFHTPTGRDQVHQWGRDGHKE
jgi:hypothetical protein